METIGYVKEFTLKRKAKKEIRFCSYLKGAKSIKKTTPSPGCISTSPEYRLVDDTSYRSTFIEPIMTCLKLFKGLPEGLTPVRMVEELSNGCIYSIKVETEEEETLRFHCLCNHISIAKDSTGKVFAYDDLVTPYIYDISGWSGSGARRVKELDHLFKDIPWKESLTYLQDVTEDD